MLWGLEGVNTIGREMGRMFFFWGEEGEAVASLESRTKWRCFCGKIIKVNDVVFSSEPCLIPEEQTFFIKTVCWTGSQTSVLFLTSFPKIDRDDESYISGQ